MAATTGTRSFSMAAMTDGNCGSWSSPANSEMSEPA